MTKTLAERIVDYRARHDLSQGEFAKLCRLSFMTIWGIENGKSTPTKLTLAKIEQILNKEESQND
jgi:transcriptional regulator with XRE-family HTH domain